MEITQAQIARQYRALMRKPRTVMSTGIIDADLLDNGTRFPNLALAKISAFRKWLGDVVELVVDYRAKTLDSYDVLFLSKVFTKTKIPVDVDRVKHLVYGGTGFYFDKAPKLPYEIEHTHPDYELYDGHIRAELERGANPGHFRDYKDCSVGFMTKGCFRGCEFCVNRNCKTVERHSYVEDFLDETKKYICLYDDNVLGYKDWRGVFRELEATGKRYCFKQGMDIRLLTREKAEVLANSRYYSAITFAFDNYKDRQVIEKKIKLWREYYDRPTRFYVLCAFFSLGLRDVVETFERIRILFSHKCFPYVMRHENFEDSEYRGMYINLARWSNMVNCIKKLSFRQFCVANGKKSATYKYMREFEKKHPEVAEKYFDMKYLKMGKK